MIAYFSLLLINEEGKENWNPLIIVYLLKISGTFLNNRQNTLLILSNQWLLHHF